MRNLLFLISLVLFFSKGLAQDQMPTVYFIDNDTSIFYELDYKYWQILEDRSNEFTIDRVSESAFKNKFHSISNVKNGIDYSIHTFWIQYRLKNITTQNITICLLNNNYADQADFYFSSDNINWLHKITGTLTPLYKRDGLKKNNCIPLLLSPGEEITIRNRLINNYYLNKPVNLSVELGNYEKVLQQRIEEDEQKSISQALEYLFYGIYLFGIFVYFFFYLVNRERLYLYYSLFLVFLFLGFEPLPYIFFPNHLFLYFYFNALIGWAGVVLYIQFIRVFLNTSLSTPKWDKFLNAICVLLAFSVIGSFFIEPHFSGGFNRLTIYVNSILFVIGLLSMLITLLLHLYRKKSSVILLLISGGPVIIYEVLFYSSREIYSLLGNKFNINGPKFLPWLDNHSEVINSFLMAWLAIGFSWILFQRFLQLQKRNTEQELEKVRLQNEKEVERNQLIAQQKGELEKQVNERTHELKQSLENLKSTQSQLIQSEKMASLGELTAGIAHEIQNPLNFVNNFSEVNKELLAEMKEEISRGNYTNAEAIALDIMENEDKINQHGKRADAIVKGMLQHSQTGGGVKEPTNINVLADEYMRLAYHGFKAKDKAFNALMKTDFDTSIGKIDIIPQDIGRVMLNLINNAFYAVNERSKEAISGYEPEVTVSTRLLTASDNSLIRQSANSIIISVKDNGNGIPDKIKEKIFQPFFTTKPTGQGTGLGLSLSYDIVKAHGGELRVDAKEGEGSEFIIQLPIN